MKTVLSTLACLLTTTVSLRAQPTAPAPLVGHFVIVEERIKTLSTATPAEYRSSLVVRALPDTLPVLPVRVRRPAQPAIQTRPVWPSSETSYDPESVFHFIFLSHPRPGTPPLLVRPWPQIQSVYK